MNWAHVLVPIAMVVGSEKGVCYRDRAEKLAGRAMQASCGCRLGIDFLCLQFDNKTYIF